MEPEECLRSLADDAVRRAQAGELVLHCSLGVRATVNAFVMLGLVPEGRADQIQVSTRPAATCSCTTR